MSKLVSVSYPVMCLLPSKQSAASTDLRAIVRLIETRCNEICLVADCSSSQIVGFGYREGRLSEKSVQRDSHAVCGAVESNMAHLPGHDRSQLLLLPEVVDDYVAADNPVRFIEAFVDGLDLAALGFIGTVPKATGRPGYAPADLLKLYIYGYLNRVRSSRRLEAETHRNIEVIWLLRHLKPDFKTIADFRRDNRKGIVKLAA